MGVAKALNAGLSIILCGAAIGAALVSQHLYDMQPCPWCVLQRLIFVVIAGLGLMELALIRLGSGMAIRASAGLRLLAAVGGVSAALWQHFVAASSLSCNLSWAERFMAATTLDGLLPDIFQARANCMEAKAWLLGVPYEFWSGALYLLLAALAMRALIKRSA